MCWKPLAAGGTPGRIWCRAGARRSKVGVEIVSEVYGVTVARGVAGGFVVTSGSFTAEAAACGARRNVRLIAGTQLHAMLQSAIVPQQPGQKHAQRERPAVPPCLTAIGA